MGRYLAGNANETASIVGFNMLPTNIILDGESDQNGTQGIGECDAPIQVDYTFDGASDATTGQWLYFQDGPVAIDNSPGGCSGELEVLR